MECLKIQMYNGIMLRKKHLIVVKLGDILMQNSLDQVNKSVFTTIVMGAQDGV